VDIQGFLGRISSSSSETHASPENICVCGPSDSSANVYQTCSELSMNTKAPAARYVCLFLSANEHSTFEFSQHTRHEIAPQFIPRTTIFRKNSIVEQHGTSPILEAVSHTNMLSFARFKDQPFRRSSPPTRISDITALS